MLSTLLAITLLGGCKPKTLAPEPVPVDPELSLDSDGYFHGDQVTIEGNARGLTAVQVNGQEAYRNDDAYQATVDLERGVNLVVVTGTDERGDSHTRRQGVISGDYASSDAPVEEAVTLRLNEPGIDKLLEPLEDLLVAQDFPSLVTGLNPVYQGSYDVLGFEAGSVSASVLDLDYRESGIDIDLDPRPGLLEAFVLIPGLDVTIGATGQAIGFDFDETVTLSGDVYLNLSVAAEVDADGHLQLNAYNPQLQLIDFGFDVSILPGPVESLLEGRVEDLIEERVGALMDDLLPTLLQDRFADLEIAFATELLGKSIAIEGLLREATIDELGLELHTAVVMDVERGVDTGTAGYLASPTLPASPSRLDDLSMTVNDNLLNNILFQAWRAGVLSRTLDSANGDIDAALLAPLGARGSARVIIEAAVPPVMIEQDNSALVQITELLVRVETPNGDNGEFLDLAVHAFVDLDLVVEGGVLKLSLNEPRVEVDVRGSDWGVTDNTLNAFLVQELPIDTLLALLGQIEIPLPSVAGFSLYNAEAFRDASGVHTAIGATF